LKRNFLFVLFEVISTWSLIYIHIWMDEFYLY
jgi:hypothetical protein